MVHFENCHVSLNLSKQNFKKIESFHYSNLVGLSQIGRTHFVIKSILIDIKYLETFCYLSNFESLYEADI